MKTAVAVSGGIDSLYALITLKEQGHEVFALHARFIDTEYDVIPALKNTCHSLNIPLHVADLRKEFNASVIFPFFDFYQNAQTPNPCALCNKSMKFGKLLEYAKKLGAEKLATGHYVRLVPFENSLTNTFGMSIQCAKDDKKDQSYFLALTPLKNLQSALFPLAEKTKEEIIQELANKNIPVPCPKESQEVCFVPHDDYRSFLISYGKEFQFDAHNHGDIFYFDSNTKNTKKIAEHKGLWAYTEGQRKGLGIAWSEPLYVIKRDKKTNSLFVSTKDAVNTKFALADRLNFFVPPSLWTGQLYARTRFREKQSPCNVYLKNNKEKLEVLIDNPDTAMKLQTITPLLSDEHTQLFIEFTEEKQIYASGQILAIYDEKGFLLAGGILL
jgi:tRNA-specific 2-thiouridylase